MASGLVAAPAAAADGSAASPVYGDALADGWADWSWGSTVDLAAASGQAGSMGISVRTDHAWGGLYLAARTALRTGPDTAVELAVRPRAAGATVALVVYGEARQPLHAPEVAGEQLTAGSWTTVRVRLSELGLAGQAITGLSLQDFTGTTGHVVDVDDVTVTGATPSPVAAAPAEVRPGNAVPNATPGRHTDPTTFFGYEGFRPYFAQVDGKHTGTTEEILRWAADKWGFDDLGVPDIAQAMAVVETWWRQEHVGVHGELGILQVNPGAWPDSGPAAWSTAYSADYAMAVVRHHYDGSSWLGDATRGDLRNAIAAWECGCGWNGGGWYTTRVFGYLDTEPWQRPGVPPEWF